MIELFIVDGFLLCLALVVLAVGRNPFFLNRIGHGLIAAAMVSGLLFAVHTFIFSPTLHINLFTHPSLGVVSFHFDKLSLFFLSIILVGGIVTSISGIGYLSREEYYRSLKPNIAATVLLFFSMQILIVADHAFLFLIAWEMMALSGYLGIILERERRDVQKGSLTFLIATHIGTFFLYLMFLLLHQQTGSWEFSVFSHHSYLPSVISSIFWLGFIGFGMKAGFMPLHFWKPEAYPVAPGHISAVLSAVMPKTGIYGLIRLITWIQPADYFLPSALFAISSGTAIIGIWNALTQKDLKRMLAYSSVENIGIIGMALAVMIFGIEYHQPLVTFLGLAGVLFQTVNHFVFKSLLFLSSGTIQLYFQHRNIEQMGGMMKTAPVFGCIVLIGSIAISGLPPFNGFASEFLIFSSFFEASHSLQGYFPFFMLIGAVALAFVGGLAVLGFSKIFSMIFLGKSKTTIHHPVEITQYEMFTFYFLTLCIIVLGLFPQIIVGASASIFHELFPTTPSVIFTSSIETIQSVGIIALAILLLTMVIFLLKKKIIEYRTTRITTPWGCGYALQTSRMQYTGTSFSDTIVNIAGKALTAEKEFGAPTGTFPKSSFFRTNVKDFVLFKIIVPSNKWLGRFTDRFKWLQSSQIQVYVAFSIVVLVFYLYLAFHL